MELRQLEYFMAVCQELHFTRAAEKLNIAQPTLSQQIRSLEDEVGLPLFDRIGRKIALTEAGKIMLGHCQRVFHEIEQARLAIRDLDGLERGALSIGSLLTCTNYLLPPAIQKYKQLYSNVELSVFGLRAEEIEKELLENNLDLGITFLPAENKDIVAIPLYIEELSLAVPMDHPFANEQQIEMRALENEPTILLPKNYFLRQLIDSYCSEIGIALKPTLEMTTMESLTQMVSEGIGMTILPAPYLDYKNNNYIGNVKLINPTPKREIGLIYRKNKFMCTATKAFIDLVTETGKSY